MDHKERILDFCVESKKPWLLLMPNYVIHKQYYKKATRNINRSDGSLFYGVPSIRYEYEHPDGEKACKFIRKILSCKNMMTFSVLGKGHDSSPFFSFWFIYDPLTKRSVRCGDCKYLTENELFALDPRSVFLPSSLKRPSSKKRLKIKRSTINR